MPRALLILAVLIAGAIAVRVFFPGVLDPRAALAWLQTRSFAEQLGAYVLAYTVLTTLAVPALAFHMVAGVAFGIERGILIALIGANLASNLHFGIGRVIGAERLQAWLEKKGVARHLHRHGIVSVMLLRAFPLPFVAVNAGLGASGLAWHHFAIGSGLGLVAATTVQTIFGAQLYEGVEGARLQALGWAVAAGLGLVGLALFGTWLRNRRAPAP